MQAWNAGTHYKRNEQQARGVATCTMYILRGTSKSLFSHIFFQPVCMHTLYKGIVMEVWNGMSND